MIELINRFITKEDELLISETTNEEFDLLVNSIENWNNFNNGSKHIITPHDKLGMHLLRCLLSERIIDFNRDKFLSEKYDEYDFFRENGYVVISGNKMNIIEKLYKHLHFSKNVPLRFNILHDKGGKEDIQHGLHVDTFHSTIKIIGYDNNVTIKNGPFTYVVGTHKNTKQKLKWLYDVSTYRSIENNDYCDSFRLVDEYKSWRTCKDDDVINSVLHKYDLPEETLFEYKKNNYIIVDTSGLHRKYPSKKGHDRITKRCMVRPRPNPFGVI